MHAKLQEDLRGGSSSSSSSAAAPSQHVQRLPPNWKNLSSSSFSFFLQIGAIARGDGKEMNAASWGGEQERSGPCRWSVLWKSQAFQGGNDNDKLFQQTNAIRGWPPSWLLRGQTILTPPPARKQHLASFPHPNIPNFLCWLHFARSNPPRETWLSLQCVAVCS